MKRRKKVARGQMKLTDFKPPPTWEQQRKNRPKRGTVAYRDWWSGLTQEQQEMELEEKK